MMDGDMNHMFNVLKAWRDTRDNDPLLQKGIGEDWVCCMGPQTYAEFERQIIERDPAPFPPNSVIGSMDRVAALVRRTVFVFNDIEYGRLEYMPLQQAYARDLAILFKMRDVQDDKPKRLED